MDFRGIQDAFQDVYPQVTGEYCLRGSFNLTFPHETDAGIGWTSPYHYGINLGPVVLMCENCRSGLLWGADARVPVHRDGAAAGGFHEGLVMTVMEDRGVTLWARTPRAGVSIGA